MPKALAQDILQVDENISCVQPKAGSNNIRPARSIRIVSHFFLILLNPFSHIGSTLQAESEYWNGLPYRYDAFDWENG